MLGTFYPPDIRGDMLGCVITNRKINAETHMSEISFSSNHILKGGGGRQLLIKMTPEWEDLPGCGTRTGWNQALAVNKSGCVLGAIPSSPPLDNPALPGPMAEPQA